MNHLKRVILCHDRYPTREHYPFSLPLLQQTNAIELRNPISVFVGENGTGKSTVLEAIARRCGIHIWREPERRRAVRNPYEGQLPRYMDIEWADGAVPGSFFASEVFRHFAELFDEFASLDPGQLEPFGGRSLVTQSHGESFMAFFASRYRIKGLTCWTSRRPPSRRDSSWS